MKAAVGFVALVLLGAACGADNASTTPGQRQSIDDCVRAGGQATITYGHHDALSCTLPPGVFPTGVAP